MGEHVTGPYEGQSKSPLEVVMVTLNKNAMQQPRQVIAQRFCSNRICKRKENENMQRYIVPEQILGAMLSNFFLNKKPEINEIKLSELNFAIRSISYQMQEQCAAIVNFSGKDIYHFINDNEKYFWLDNDRVILSQYTENKRQFDYNGIQDLFDTKFIAGLPEDIISIVTNV